MGITEGLWLSFIDLGVRKANTQKKTKFDHLARHNGQYIMIGRAEFRNVAGKRRDSSANGGDRLFMG